MQIKWQFLFITLGFILISCSGSHPTGEPGAAGPKPAWLINYPVDPQYYVGIGSASKTGNGTDALKSAQDLALADLASQISVTVTSDIITTLIEKGAITEDEYLATARSQAVADLEGHEFVDSWQDQNYHYAYYRLSKAKYAEVQDRKRNAATDLSLDLLNQAQAGLSAGDFNTALNTSLQSFSQLLPYLNEALKVQFDGNQVILSNVVYQFIQNLLGEITLTPQPEKVKGKLGRPLDTGIEIQVQRADGQALSNLTLVAGFSQGGGTLTESLVTNTKGTASLQVLNLSSSEKLQIIEVALDQDALLRAELSPLIVSLIKSVATPKTQIMVEVTTPTIYLKSSEEFNGQALKLTQVEPLLKNHFVEAGFHFVKQPEAADWLMHLDAAALQGTEYSGLFTAFATVNLSVTDRQSGEELYKNSLKRVKGIDLSYVSAANKALSEAGVQLSASIIPELLESLK